MEKASLEQQIRGALEALVAIPGYLAGLNTIEDCMQNEGVRAYVGHGLLDEIFPSLACTKEEAAEAAMAVLQDAEHSPRPLFSLCIQGTTLYEQWLLPCLQAKMHAEGLLPPCLTFALSCLVLYFSGAKKTEAGYIGLTDTPFQSDDAALAAFACLSPDMPAETLAYAALSDRDIWSTDLRAIDGLIDHVTAQLQDLQILGLKEAMNKCRA